MPLKVKVEQLEAPHLQRLLRRVNDCFVESLKLKLQQDPTGPGVPPLALLCKEERDKEKFREDLSGQYKFAVIGGLHSVEARKRLSEEYPGEVIMHLVTVYMQCMFKLLRVTSKN